LPEPWHDANVAGRRAAAVEAGRVAWFGDEVTGGLGPHADYLSEQFANFVSVEFSLDVAVEIP
jgi:hypothetical protein